MIKKLLVAAAVAGVVVWASNRVAMVKKAIGPA